MKLVKYVNPSLRSMIDIAKSLWISDEDMGSIVGHLKHNKQYWGYIYPSHPQYKKTLKDIQELLPENLIVSPVIVVHFEANWMLVVENGILLPAIFLFNSACRDGISVSVFRLVHGRACRWLPQAPSLVQEIVKETQVPLINEGVTPSSPYVVLDLGNGLNR
jgi:hypothetical protein